MVCSEEEIEMAIMQLTTLGSLPLYTHEPTRPFFVRIPAPSAPFSAIISCYMEQPDLWVAAATER